MAGEIQLAHNATGKTLYALVRNATGSVWNASASAFQAYATANLSAYALTLAEQGTASRYYVGPFPTAIAAGTYAVAAYERAGAGPAEGDTLAAAGNVEWDGAALVALSSRLPTSAYTAPDNATIAAIQADTDDLQSRLPSANQNADALLDRAAGVETSFTPRQALRLMLAALAGKLSGAATTTVTIRNVGDTKDRITATVDADGNRTALTLDAS